VLAKHSFDTMLELMRETRANWLARVAVEGCEGLQEVALDMPRLLNKTAERALFRLQ
jgi:hypothetical protein